MVDTQSYKRTHKVNWRSQPLSRLDPQEYRRIQGQESCSSYSKVLVPVEDHRLRALGAEVEFLE